MIDVMTMGRWETIYTYVERETGENTNIAVGRLAAWVEEQRARNAIEVVNVPLTSAFVAKLIREQSVSQVWCAQMLCDMTIEKIAKMPPIIFLLDGTMGANGAPNGMLADGHHRYVVFAALGMPHIAAVTLAPAQWEPFRISGLDDVTDAQLRDMPVVKVVRGGKGA